MVFYLRTFLIFCLTVLLIACRTTETASQKGKLEEQAKSPQQVEQLLRQAGKGQSEKAQKLRLTAAELAFNQGNLEVASNILEQLAQANLPIAEQMLVSALNADIALAKGQHSAALVALKQPGSVHLDELAVTQQIRYQRVYARVLEANAEHLAALRVRLYIAPLLEEPNKTTNDEVIWILSKQLAASSPVQTSGDNVLDGWLALARAANGSGTGSLLYQQQQAIRAWQQQNPQHPAAQKLPTELEKLLQQHQQLPTRIALLLPYEGPLVSVSRALHDGFLAARLQEQQAGGQPPVVDVYDSNQITDMEAFYQQVKANGTNLVVGPLEKPLVRQLAMREQLPLPTLALNYAEAAGRSPADLFQFGLAAEDEARAAAQRAAENGMRRAVVMVPKSEWGERILNVFHQTWDSLGGQVVAVEYLDQPVHINDQVANLLRLLGKRTPSSMQSHGTRLIAEESTRYGGDFMFLAATAQQAQQIKPTLAYHQAAHLPVYATSHLYNGSLSAQQARDLDGIYFCETPWLLGAVGDAPLHQQVLSGWPQAKTSLGRLYAMGIDAFRLTLRLSQLKGAENASYDGLTGQLSLDQNQRIVRRLPWAAFRNGRVQRLPQVHSQAIDEQPIETNVEQQ